MPNLPKKLQQKLAGRAEANELRKLPQPLELVDFSSNDYLGFAKNEHLFQRAAEILKEKNLKVNGATGSRLLSGNHPLYILLEKKLASYHEVESSLVFNSGYDANLGFFGSVPQRGDVVFYDELIHASIRDGIKMGNAKSYKFKHNDLKDLKIKCRAERSRSPNGTVFYIVTESVFSMDGDSPDLNAFAAFCRARNYYLVVDEAHALGVFGNEGKGLVQQLGLQKEVFARIITFGKAMGCHGAAILGSQALTSYLVNFARSIIYTTGLPPHTVATILAAHEFTATGKGAEQRKRLGSNIRHFNLELETLKLKQHFLPNDSAIHCCIVPENKRVKRVTKKIREKGFDVKPILSPTVPKGQERLRFCLHSFNTKAQISKVLSNLSNVLTAHE